jgi:hypothetical protein
LKEERKMVDKKKGFVIYGKVMRKESKKSITGLTVEALDKNLLIDNRLSAAVTDKDGNFEILYEGKDFKEVFFDQKPDIYLRVKNRKGEVVYTIENKVKYGATRVKEFNIAISEKMLEKVEVKAERLQFKQFLSINPNYFGSNSSPLIQITLEMSQMKKLRLYIQQFTQFQVTLNMKNYPVWGFILKITCWKRLSK